MIDPKGLERAPEPMAHMNRRNDHRSHINEYIDRVCKCIGQELKRSGVGFIHKMKIYQMKNNKEQQNKTGVGHGCRSQGPPAGPFVDRISEGPGFKVLIKKKRTGHDMYDGKK